jgi:DNA-binding XRE family transcriptional regulator
MATPAKVAEVRQLLAQGNISQRQIARFLGISRGTVGAIASGKRPDYSPKIPELPLCLLPPVRCRGCGGYVHPPCRVCRLRNLRAQELARVQAHPDYSLLAAG